MKTFVILLLVIFNCKTTNGQIYLGTSDSEITRVLRSSDPEEIRNGSAEKIIEYNTNFYLDGKRHYWITEKELNDFNQCSYEYSKDYVNDSLISENSITRIFKNRLLDSVIYKGWSIYDTIWRVSTSKYKYNENGHIQEKISHIYPYGGASKLRIEKISYQTDERGFPTNAIIDRGQGPLKQESAIYLEGRNELEVTKIGKTINIIDTMIIDHRIAHKYPNEKRRYNIYGDIVFVSSESGHYHFEYKYDSHQNWIRYEKYYIDLHELKVVIEEVTVREIIYKKE